MKRNLDCNINYPGLQSGGLQTGTKERRKYGKRNEVED